MGWRETEILKRQLKFQPLASLKQNKDKRDSVGPKDRASH